uniref:Ig-like domain-containing protein n=1 Tax=Chelydra serpentina TaxID=8475 RepID=A0A8C3SAE6_CHESE
MSDCSAPGSPVLPVQVSPPAQCLPWPLSLSFGGPPHHLPPSGLGVILSPLPLGRFVFQFKADCQFTNGTERVRYLGWYIYNQQQFVHFDSDVGVWVGDTEVGRRWAEGWNKDKAEMDYRRSEVDTFCRHNYGVYGSFTVARRGEWDVKVSPTQSGSQPHPHLLVCSVTGFYPGGIEIKWLKNGQEQTVGVVSTELLQNGDWTFQILVMLEMRPRRGDIYTCQVEHVSLRDPITVRWGKSLWVWGNVPFLKGQSCFLGLFLI